MALHTRAERVHFTLYPLTGGGDSEMLPVPRLEHAGTLRLGRGLGPWKAVAEQNVRRGTGLFLQAPARRTCLLLTAVQTKAQEPSP